MAKWLKIVANPLQQLQKMRVQVRVEPESTFSYCYSSVNTLFICTLTLWYSLDWWTCKNTVMSANSLLTVPSVQNSRQRKERVFMAMRCDDWIHTCSISHTRRNPAVATTSSPAHNWLFLTASLSRPSDVKVCPSRARNLASCGTLVPTRCASQEACWNSSPSRSSCVKVRFITRARSSVHCLQWRLPARPRMIFPPQNTKCI